jgi:hypothetical protein
MTWDPASSRLASACIDQLERSIGPDGRLSLRLDRDGRPTSDSPSDDAQGRALWGAAIASTSALPPELRRRSARLFRLLSGLQTSHARAASHAVLAAGVVLGASPRSVVARRLVAANASAVPRPRSDPEWPWPEPRLTYGNGVLVEALLALAGLARDDVATQRAVRLLRWLVAHERGASGVFSFTPVGGRGPMEPGGFDQQPIEPWALAEACVVARGATGSDEWIRVVDDLSDWFDGRNDLGVQMWDPATGAAYDGLTERGPNVNEGTESTLALVGTRLAAWRIRQAADAVSRRSSR